jgi:hypothetical protein
MQRGQGLPEQRLNIERTTLTSFLSPLEIMVGQLNKKLFETLADARLLSLKQEVHSELHLDTIHPIQLYETLRHNVNQ